MHQTGTVCFDHTVIHIQLPAPEREVMDGIKWGLIEAFLSPAYWAYQVLARRIEGKSIQYKLGRTLKEEVGACLLGGHGIPAKMGLAAYEHVKAFGAFGPVAPTGDDLLNWLLQPIEVDGRFLHYRFARQKAKYLAAALSKLQSELPPVDSGLALRNWLTQIPGIGLKTASWIARNWLDADDVAILDIHILRAGMIAGFFKKELTVERHYLELEKQFIAFSRALEIRPSELDAVMWLDMMSSPTTVHRILGEPAQPSKSKTVKRGPTNHRHTDTNQSMLLI